MPYLAQNWKPQGPGSHLLKNNVTWENFSSPFRLQWESLPLWGTRQESGVAEGCKERESGDRQRREPDRCNVAEKREKRIRDRSDNKETKCHVDHDEAEWHEIENNWGRKWQQGIVGEGLGYLNRKKKKKQFWRRLGLSFEFLEVLEERLLNDLGSSLKKKKEGKLRKIVGEREGWVEREKRRRRFG